jgi:hypothetical protein
VVDAYGIFARGLGAVISRSISRLPVLRNYPPVIVRVTTR